MQLSYYLDTVELELSTSLAQRSDLFFSALAQQQSMNLELVDVLNSIKGMRASIPQLPCPLVTAPLSCSAP